MARKQRADGEGTLFRRKDGRWAGEVQLGYKPDGKPHRVTVYARTQREALEKLEAAKRNHAAGVATTAPEKVADYLKKWLDHKERTVKPRTVEIYRSLADLHIIPKIGGIRLDRLKPLNVQRMVTEIAEETGVPTANKARRVLNGAMKQAVQWQMVPRNVVQAVEPLSEPRREMVIWSAEEARRFLAEASKHRLYAAFYLAMATGLRRGEILGLYWSDLDGDTLHIQRSLTTRNGRPAWSTPKTSTGKRLVVVPGDALAVLEQHRSAQELERQAAAADGSPWPEKPALMFPTPSGEITTPTMFNHRWRRLQDAAKVPPARLHDLRHLHVSLLVRQGFDPRTIADRVGHADAAFTLRRYSHMFERQRRAAAVDLGALLDHGEESGR